MDRRHALAAGTAAAAGLAILSTPAPPVIAAYNDVVTLDVGVTAWRPVPRDPPQVGWLDVSPSTEQVPTAAPDDGIVPEVPATDPAGLDPEPPPGDTEPTPDPAPDDQGSEPGAPPASEPTAAPTDDATASPVEEAPSTAGQEPGVTGDAASVDPAPTP